jgi:putative nucleotidyltransferase with HDIG domain
MKPGVAALETMRITRRRTGGLLSLGTDGTHKDIPLLGEESRGSIRFLTDWPRTLSVQGRLFVYAGVLAAFTASFTTGLIATNHSLGNPWVVLTLALVAAVTERASVRFSSAIEQSISLLPALFAAVLFGPLAAMCVGAASALGDFRRPYMRWALYTLSRSVTGAVIGLAAIRATHLVPNELAGIVVATAFAAVLAELLDVTFGSLIFWLRGHGKIVDPIRQMAPALMGSVPLYAPVVALLAFAYEVLSPWTVPLFVVPALVAQHAFVLYREQQRLTEDLVTANRSLERANLSFASALVATLDARDRYTAGHSAVVAIYARDIAQRLGLDETQQRLAHLCGLVHDIGKIGLPPGLLEKPGALTLEERRLMETHSEIGEKILANVDDYAEVAKIVRHHHERVDGQGYPDGLSESDIPLLSRIIAVADAYNAMTSDRPYRDAMPSRVARMRLAQAVESQFDTTVAAAFEAVLAGADEEYRAGTRFDFDLEVREAESPAPALASLRAVEVA